MSLSSFSTQECDITLMDQYILSDSDKEFTKSLRGTKNLA